MTSPRRSSLLLLALCALPLAAQPAAPKKGPSPKKEEAPQIKPFETALLAPNSWYGRFGVTNCAWMDLGDGVLLVDTGATAADAVNLRNEVKRTTKGKPIRWIVLTHLHQDSNGGLPTLLPADVTIYANQKEVPAMAVAFDKRAVPGKHATIVGVTDRLFVLFGAHPIEFFVPKGAAHTESDLVAFSPETGVAYVGDLVTPGRCPMMSDPATNPTGWSEALDRIAALHPAVLIPTRGDAAVDKNLSARGGLEIDTELKATRAYIERLVKNLTDLKKRNAPEPQVASELRMLAGTGDYCPGQMDAINALSLYRRMTPEGDFPPAAPKPPAAPAASQPQ